MFLLPAICRMSSNMPGMAFSTFSRASHVPPSALLEPNCDTFTLYAPRLFRTTVTASEKITSCHCALLAVSNLPVLPYRDLIRDISLSFAHGGCVCVRHWYYASLKPNLVYRPPLSFALSISFKVCAYFSHAYIPCLNHTRIYLEVKRLFARCELSVRP